MAERWRSGGRAGGGGGWADRMLNTLCPRPPLPPTLQAEASDVFFSVTKLFQHKDVHLRRMVYLVIKEIIPSSDEVIIITSSLMKDMNSKNDLYRANAIRVLCRIIDSQMLLQIERYLKQAVVDKSAVVASAVLAGAIHLAAGNAEVIKRWSNEVQEAITSKHPMVSERWRLA